MRGGFVKKVGSALLRRLSQSEKQKESCVDLEETSTERRNPPQKRPVRPRFRPDQMPSERGMEPASWICHPLFSSAPKPAGKVFANVQANFAGLTCRKFVSND